VLAQQSVDFNVGASASGRQLVVSNGGTVRSLVGVIGRNSTASNNKATVTGSNSLWTNSSGIFVGQSGSGNSLVISNGGTATGNSVTIGQSIGGSLSASNNSVLVTGANSRLNSSGQLSLGSGGGGDSLVISNGGTVAVSSSSIVGSDGSSLNNSALVTGAGSLWTNSGTLTLGLNNTNNALTVSDGGTLAASDILIAANTGSSGTLNIGRFGTNDAAGTITAPTIAFRFGTGAVNFNQSDSTTLSAAISGNGVVNQLGTGTTTLSGANTYTGGTAVSAGSLVGTTTSLQGAIANNAAVTFDQSTAGTYSGAMSGSGSLTKTGIGRLSLSGSSSYNGATAVSAGDLNLSGGSITNSAVTVASGASLSGYGSVGTIGGAGAINPGNSPGILTTPQVDPSSGTDFNFEMTGTAPTYNNASNSVNDVIRITGATPFSQALAAGNGVFIYFSGAALFTGSTAVQYQGGFFTDQSASFASSISGATYNYYFANTNGPTTYNGVSYYNKAQYESLVLGTNMLITVSTVAQTANFGSGNVNGQVMQIDVIPEPSTYALLVLAVIGLGVQCWRRRRKVA
jgi:T5SS/PEP-CTERM-associated repeat protein/autotransporter-associated beta strand protein